MADKLRCKGSTILVFYVPNSGVMTSTQNVSTAHFKLGYGSETTSSDDLGGDEDNDSASDADRTSNSEHDEEEMPDDDFAPSQTVSRSTEKEDKDALLDAGLVPYVDSDSDSDFVIQKVDLKGTDKDSSTTARFKAASTSNKLHKLSGKTFADSTDKKIVWAVNLFMSWHRSRILDNTAQGDIEGANLYDDQICPEKLVRSLCCFLNEVCRQDGADYPGNMLYSLVVMIQLHLEKQGKDWKLMDGKQFPCVRNTLNNLMKQRALAHISKAAKSAEPISVNNEQKLWDEGVLGEMQPDQLRLTLMYLLGLTFALHGCREQHALRCLPHDPQITVQINSEGNEYLLYKEDIHSKTNQGGLKTRKLTPKTVKAYSHSEYDCNVVRLYKKYVSLLPDNGKSDALYKYSLMSSRRTGHTWYSNKPLGINTINKTVKTLMSEIGKIGHFMNHSLRVSAATRMYSEGVDEQVLKERMGHKSDVVRAYKKTLESLLKSAEKATIGDTKPVKLTPTSTVTRTTQKRHIANDEDSADSMTISQVLKKVDTSSTHVQKVKFEVKYHDN